jgi:hypothetical protein
MADFTAFRDGCFDDYRPELAIPLAVAFGPLETTLFYRVFFQGFRNGYRIRLNSFELKAITVRRC